MRLLYFLERLFCFLVGHKPMSLRLIEITEPITLSKGSITLNGEDPSFEKKLRAIAKKQGVFVSIREEIVCARCGVELKNADYVIERKGNRYYDKNGKTKQIIFEGEDASSVIQQVINILSEKKK